MQRSSSSSKARAIGPRDDLGALFLRSAARHAERIAVLDSSGARLSYRRLLVSALALAPLLRRRFAPEERVGILLPPSAAGAIANLATALAGRVAVNLNYSLGRESMEDTIRRARIRTFLGSQRFLEALGERPGGAELLALEGLAGAIPRREKLRAALLARLPGPLLARLAGPRVDSSAPATILFSSGSTGRPKGVVLSHANLLSNVLAMSEAFELRPDDRLLGILPFFHSFGTTVTLWAPLCAGASIAYHARPTDARTIEALCRDEGVTILVATPTFYRGWMRRIAPESLAGVRLAVVGAEKLRPSLAEAWRERYGLELHQGYGCTELSPVVSVELPPLESRDGPIERARAGSVGRPLPGVRVRIVQRETGEPLGPGREGRVLVAGPGVMQGYLDDPVRTAEVLHEGWYDTGDIGLVDEDGFLFLTDRAARWSKIGGEMVPHGLVEERLGEVARRLARELGAGEDEPEFAVTALPDERKGEHLVVLHTPLPFGAERLVEELRGGDLPALFQPRPDHYHEVAAIPQLASGKLDLVRLRELASQCERERAEPKGS